MAGKVLNIDQFFVPDQLGWFITRQYCKWEIFRHAKIAEWAEVQKYVFATDTTKTSNNQLPWSNKTTIPKLCQIRDNLFSNYIASMFPKRKNYIWQGDTESDDDTEKTDAIQAYINWATDRNQYYNEANKLTMDFIDYGNCFGTVEWVDDRTETGTGFVGPAIRRIAPIDIVFDPTAPSFEHAPKIIRSLVSIGEVKDMLLKQSMDDGERETAEELWEYMQDFRTKAREHTGDVRLKDDIYQVSGYSSYQDYLDSGMVEILTFYGDIYDETEDVFKKNAVIKIVDRHKVITDTTHPSVYGHAPIFHAGWRIRPDLLWAMGPLDNLVGMQYRIDHLENMKADCFDLIAYPPLIIKGYVDDFTWGPMERIYTGEDGDVELRSPDVQALQADNQIAILESKMEEMAGSPKEAMGFRTPGEKTKYEVQRLENAASRIFQNKIASFERDMIENLLNAMLEMARRNMSDQTIRVFDDEFKINAFIDLTPLDITGNGRIKPMAARHFAEQAQMVQDLNSFRQSAAGADPALLVHFSTVREARLWEQLLDIEEFKIVEPFVRLAEEKDAQMMQNIGDEQVASETATPSGLNPEDFLEEEPDLAPEQEAE